MSKRRDDLGHRVVSFCVISHSTRLFMIGHVRSALGGAMWVFFMAILGFL